MKAVSGNPDFEHVSTSFVERQNWTVRTTMRCYNPAIEWILPQTGESRGGDGAKLFRLQLHQNSSYTSHVSGHGRWALQIDCGAWKIWLPSGKPTSSGGRKERRK